jgi:hypothetical protein
LPPVTDAPWEMVRLRDHGFNNEADHFQIASSFEQCELVCQNEQSCVGLSYLFDQKTCKLFQAIGEYSPDEQSDSGIKHQRALGLATKFHPTFLGELQALESSTYIVIRGTMSWDAPSKEAAALFALSQNQEVHALGSFNNVWIKIATADGNEGFVSTEDLLTPKQFATRQDLIAKRDSVLEYFERARHSWGLLAGATGVYPHFSGGCIEAVDLANGLHLLVNLAISTRWLQWSEGESFYRVNLLNTTPVRWRVTARVEPRSAWIRLDRRWYAEQTQAWLKPLLDFYDALHPILAEWTLRDGGPDGPVLTGAGKGLAGGAHEHIASDAGETVVLTGSRGVLRFGPLLSAHRCDICQERHVFFYDKGKREKNGPQGLRTDLLEYLRGHPKPLRGWNAALAWEHAIAARSRILPCCVRRVRRVENENRNRDILRGAPARCRVGVPPGVRPVDRDFREWCTAPPGARWGFRDALKGVSRVRRSSH